MSAYECWTTVSFGGLIDNACAEGSLYHPAGPVASPHVLLIPRFERIDRNHHV